MISETIQNKLIAIVSIFFIIFCSCSSEKSTSPIKAKILVSTVDGYKFETVTFNTLKNLDKMNGDIAQIIGNVKLNGHATGLDDIQLHGGEDVSLNYIVEDGVVKALNYDSMAMLSIYYNFEKISEFWRDNLSLDIEDYGKFKIYYDPDEVYLDELHASTKVNAFFLPKHRDFGVMKTSTVEQLPIKLNLAVIAHEFTHGVFDYKFARKDHTFMETTNPGSQFQLSGINEGLADYFSWVVTQRSDEITRSHPAMKERALPVKWTSQSLILNPGQCIGGPFYCKGTILTSALYEISSLKKIDSLTVAKSVYAALETFRKDWITNKNSSGFDYFYLMNRIIDEANTTDKAKYCESFKKWFNDSTNLPELTKKCAV